MKKKYPVWYCVYETRNWSFLKKFKTLKNAYEYCGDEMHLLSINKEQRVA